MRSGGEDEGRRGGGEGGVDWKGTSASDAGGGDVEVSSFSTGKDESESKMSVVDFKSYDVTSASSSSLSLSGVSCGGVVNVCDVDFKDSVVGESYPWETVFRKYDITSSVSSWPVGRGEGGGVGKLVVMFSNSRGSFSEVSMSVSATGYELSVIWILVVSESVSVIV